MTKSPPPSEKSAGHPKNELPSWAVLIGAITLGIALWLGWMYWGMRLTHAKVADYADGYVSVKRKEAPKQSEGGAAQPAIDRAAVMAEVGQTGDAFGGANALFASVAGALVLWAGVLQSRSLKEAQKATRLAAQAYEDERAFNKKEQFSSTFFQMLTLSRQLVERIDVPKSDGAREERRQGAAALDSLARTLVNRLDDNGIATQTVGQQAREIATTYVGSIYDNHPSSLGPYFRLLFQTFKFVADAEMEESERIRFANIARGQMSEGTVMLLAANGLTERGHRFIPLIERFGLLEHLHSGYRNKYKPALLEGYRRRAFLGSKEREQHALETTPLCSAHYFIAWEQMERQ
ncbi:hypothetical protein EJP69_07825 [Variovorax gossypii]|uniref:Uncharacterized protein n=1 Tax=Variovorax gossypii TaxID=1679495 RepID=A0A431TK11_9BURK|nr:putative phage abortive infection protein [Variovorax gossypii]RTQ34346.1 hypothetical protein EJP69_07825 [Variovorax gossypii]